MTLRDRLIEWNLAGRKYEGGYLFYTNEVAADRALAALGLDDLDAAVERAAYPIYVGSTLKPFTSPATPEHKAETAITQEQARNLARAALEAVFHRCGRGRVVTTVEEWIEAARTQEGRAVAAEARVAKFEAALEQIANYQPGRLGYEGPRDIARLALKGSSAD